MFDKGYCETSETRLQQQQGSGDMWYLVQCSIQTSNNPSCERLQELLFWAQISPDPLISGLDYFWTQRTMISGPVVDGLFF